MAEAVTAAAVPANRVVALSAGTLSDALRDGRVESAVWPVEGAILAQRKDPQLQLGAFLGPRRAWPTACAERTRGCWPRSTSTSGS